MKILFTADWHLSEDADQKYRFDVIERLQEAPVQSWYILGDIFDRKGNHPPGFLDDVLQRMGRIRVPVTVVAGNHDGFTPEENWCRLFRYLPNMTVVWGSPQVIGAGSPFSIDCYPFGSNYESGALGQSEIAVFHGTVRGCVLNKGILAPRGIPQQFFAKYAIAIGGDIHGQQKVGENIVYVGAPHHIHFGDDFDTGALIMNTDTHHLEMFSLPVQHEKRIVRWDERDQINSLGLPKGSFVRFKSDHDISTEDRENIANIITQNGWIVDSIQCEPEPYVSVKNTESVADIHDDPKAVLDDYCSRNDISEDAKGFMVSELEAELWSVSKR